MPVQLERSAARDSSGASKARQTSAETSRRASPISHRVYCSLDLLDYRFLGQDVSLETRLPSWIYGDGRLVGTRTPDLHRVKVAL